MTFLARRRSAGAATAESAAGWRSPSHDQGGRRRRAQPGAAPAAGDHRASSPRRRPLSRRPRCLPRGASSRGRPGLSHQELRNTRRASLRAPAARTGREGRRDAAAMTTSSTDRDRPRRTPPRRGRSGRWCVRARPRSTSASSPGGRRRAATCRRARPTPSRPSRPTARSGAAGSPCAASAAATPGVATAGTRFPPSPPPHPPVPPRRGLAADEPSTSSSTSSPTSWLLLRLDPELRPRHHRCSRWSS